MIVMDGLILCVDVIERRAMIPRIDWGCGMRMASLGGNSIVWPVLCLRNKMRLLLPRHIIRKINYFRLGMHSFTGKC